MAFSCDRVLRATLWCLIDLWVTAGTQRNPIQTIWLHLAPLRWGADGCNITGHGNDLHSGTSRFNGRGVLILTATGREAGDHGKNQIRGLESSYLVKNTVWCSFQEQVMVLWRKMGSWPRAQGAQLTAAYSEAMRLSVNTSDDRKHAMASCLS